MTDCTNLLVDLTKQSSSSTAQTKLLTAQNTDLALELFYKPDHLFFRIHSKTSSNYQKQITNMISTKFSNLTPFTKITFSSIDDRMMSRLFPCTESEKFPSAEALANIGTKHHFADAS